MRGDVASIDDCYLLASRWFAAMYLYDPESEVKQTYRDIDAPARLCHS
jgi:hypothetical protein